MEELNHFRLDQLDVSRVFNTTCAFYRLLVGGVIIDRPKSPSLLLTVCLYTKKNLLPSITLDST